MPPTIFRSLRRGVIAATLAAVALAAALAGVLQAAPAAAPAVQFTGVNLAGAEFGETALPGAPGVNYIYPSRAEVDYFAGKGMNTIRLPFLWERLQRSAGAELDAAELARLDEVVGYATGRGLYVLLDPHNYARYNGQLVGSQVPASAFANLWGRLAARYRGNQRVVFGLMNEPREMPTEQWLTSANAAIAAIRAAGAGNLITVPGNAWTGAWSWEQSWYGAPNGTVMLGVQDPANNYIYEVHQYLDGDSSGRSDQCVSETVGAERLTGFTSWLRRNGKRAILGEFGGGRNQTCYTALDTMLAHVHQNSDVWAGWTYWAAGPWWGDYIFTVEPSGGQDRPQMAVLTRYTGAAPLPATAIPTASTGVLHTPAPATPAPATPAPATPAPATPPAAGQLAAAYSVTNSWDSGYQVDVTVTNGTGAAISGWMVSWQLAYGEQLAGVWNADCRLAGATVICTPKDYNRTLAPGAQAAFGLQASTSGGRVTRPAALTVSTGVLQTPTPTASTGVLQTPTPRPATATPAPATQTPTPTASTGVLQTPTPRPASGKLSASYRVPNSWDSGYLVEIVVTNGGSAPVSGWTVSWQLANGESFASVWNADCRKAGSTVTCTSKDYNGNLAPGASASFGLQANTSGGKVTQPAALTVTGR